MRLFILACLLSFTAIVAVAQEDLENTPVSTTPREQIVESLSGQPAKNDIESAVAQILLELRGANENLTVYKDLSVPPTIELEENETVSPAIEPEESETATPIIELEENKSVSSTIEPAMNETVSEPKKGAEEVEENAPALAPFYLSAENYLELRGSKKQDQMLLEYEVETGALGENSEPKLDNIRLVIGPDYVSMTSSKSQKIYDFKLNRYLEIKPIKTLEDESTTSLLFDNASLYSKAYRNISTVRQATQNGQRRRIKISQEQDLDSFWLESSMSWAAAKLEKSLKIKSNKSSLLAIWDGLSVVSANFDEDPYENQEFKNSLFAFAHHAWPIHPKILVEFYTHAAPPKTLEMVSFGPGQPKGQQQKWTLVNRETVNARFPLPLEAKSAVERRPISPLVFIISQAIQNKALGGMPKINDISAAFWKAEADGNTLSQWLEGQRYKAYSGLCEIKTDDPVCEALVEIADVHKFSAIGSLDPKSKVLSDFINGTEMAKIKKNRASALIALQPYLNDADTPAFILRTAAMTRARMKKSQVKTSGVDSIRPEPLLKQALAKDPYDPHTYVGLAQVYAANGAFEQSWDIYDALRAGIPTVKAVSLKVDQAEEKLLATSPGYFLPN